MKVYVLSWNASKKNPKQIYKAASKKELEDPLLIDNLKNKKVTFKIVENDVEKTYYFNGNNYIITSKVVN